MITKKNPGLLNRGTIACKNDYMGTRQYYLHNYLISLAWRNLFCPYFLIYPFYLSYLQQ